MWSPKICRACKKHDIVLLTETWRLEVEEILSTPKGGRLYLSGGVNGVGIYVSRAFLEQAADICCGVTPFEHVAIYMAWTLGPRLFFPSHGPFCQQYHGPSAGPNQRHRASRSSHGMWLAKGGLRAESAKMSLKRGGSPSTLAVAVSGKERRLAAKARAAAVERKEDHQQTKAATAGSREGAGAGRARRFAKNLTKFAASWLQQPPSSRPGGVAKLRVGSLFGFAGKEERSPGRAAASMPGHASRSQAGLFRPPPGHHPKVRVHW